VGFVAIVLDAAIVHPANIIDDAAEDTEEVLWDNFEWDEKYVTECAALPWRVVLTPAIFTGSFLGRSLFDIPRRAEEARQEDEVRQRVDSMESWTDFLYKLEDVTDAGECVLALKKALNDPNPVVRHAALCWIEKRMDDIVHFETLLEAREAGEADPALRALIRRLLDRE
jgi:hypothetical protein